jgi:hypothetical protein
MEGDAQVVGPNMELYETKLGSHPEYLNNLYFTFVFLLRATNKARGILSGFDYSTGNTQEDAHVSTSLTAL